ncbi:CehA/McbA family metallohydrolase [Candidatus Hydrogenedentota bacterium]
MSKRTCNNILSFFLVTVALLLLTSSVHAHGLPGYFGEPMFDNREANSECLPITQDQAILLAKAYTPVSTTFDMPSVSFQGKVVDADTGKPIGFRLHIEDKDGNYWPPKGHLAIEQPQKNDNGITSEPDVINRGKIWACIEDGEFEIDLPAQDGYKVELVRGLEYNRPVLSLDLKDSQGEVEGAFLLKRGINMRKLGWMSADTHVHNLMPEAAWHQMGIEGLDYVNIMFVGGGHVLLKNGYVTGKPSIDRQERIVFVSQELRDAHQGHMTLIGMSEPVKPIRGRYGQEHRNIKYIPHGPLNWEVYDYMHAQGGMAFHAHYLYWPGYGSAVSAALNKLDGLEWLVPDLEMRESKTRQNIEVPGHPLTGAGPMWYYMLNCGARLPLIGGTDKMSAGRVVGGGIRTYTRVKRWDHDGFMDGLSRGETFVSNGPMLNLSANGKPIGSEIKFTGKGPHTVTLDTGYYTEKPIRYFQIIQNGKVVFERDVKRNEKRVKVKRDLKFVNSGWLAVRCGNRESDPNNWEHAYTAAHTSPIYVTVNDQMPAEKASAEYMVARLQVTLDWAKDKAIFLNEDVKKRAIESFDKAKRFYESALARASG